MRVLHFSAGNLFGGVETFLLTLARQRALCPGIEPEFAVCFQGQLSDALQAADVPVHLLGPARASRPWTVWRVRRRLRALLKGGRYDLATCHGCWPHAIAAPEVRRAGVPLVFWAHGLQSGKHWLERWAARHQPDFVLANSHATRASMPTLFPRTPVHVVYLPVCSSLISDRAAARRLVRGSLTTSEHAVVILMACRLELLKGHALLLDAMGRLGDLPDWQCWIAGGVQRPSEESYLQGLRDQCARLGIAGRIRFLGQRADIPDLLAAADIYCQPNTGPESFGIAFIEALYSGLPVVTTAIGGALEIVDETCGVLVPVNDSERLGAVLAELIRDRKRRQRLGAAGPARAAALCSLEPQMTELGRVLTCFCSSAARPQHRSVSLVRS
jgi:glycosyltransferase involved in cell wall biosynthesis